MKCFEFTLFPYVSFVPRSWISLERSNEYFVQVGDEKVAVTAEAVERFSPMSPELPQYQYVLPKIGNAHRINGQLWLDNSNPDNEGQVPTEYAALVHISLTDISNATVKIEITDLGQAQVLCGGSAQSNLLMIMRQGAEVRFKKTIVTRESLGKKWFLARERFHTTTTSKFEYLLFDGSELRLYSEQQRLDLNA